MAAYDPAAHAALICDWSLAVSPGDAVLVQYPAVAEPLALAVQQAMLEREAWPALRPEVPGTGRAYVDHAADAQLDAPNPIDVAEQKAVRLAKRDRLIAEDGDAYPVAVAITHTIPQVRERWADLQADRATGSRSASPAGSCTCATRAGSASPPSRRATGRASRRWCRSTGSARSRCSAGRSSSTSATTCSSPAR